jgi:hypothetical protein
MFDIERSEMKVLILKIIMKIIYSLQRRNLLEITAFFDFVSCSPLETYQARQNRIPECNNYCHRLGNLKSELKYLKVCPYVSYLKLR